MIKYFGDGSLRNQKFLSTFYRTEFNLFAKHIGKIAANDLMPSRLTEDVILKNYNKAVDEKSIGNLNTDIALDFIIGIDSWEFDDQEEKDNFTEAFDHLLVLRDKKINLLGTLQPLGTVIQNDSLEVPLLLMPTQQVIKIYKYLFDSLKIKEVSAGSAIFGGAGADLSSFDMFLLIPANEVLAKHVKAEMLKSK
jgi:hypothetical protein